MVHALSTLRAGPTAREARPSPALTRRMRRASSPAPAAAPLRADVFHSNSFMAQVGGISVAEMNKLEIELCIRLKWELHIVHGEYLQMVESLCEPEHPAWKKWQHQHAGAFSSDEETSSSDASQHHALPPPPPPAPAAPPPSKSLLPLWATGFRSRAAEPAQPPAGVLRRADGSHAAAAGAGTAGGSSPVNSVSVR